MPSINQNLINNLIEQAKESKLQQHLAASIVVNNKQLSNSFCNVDRNFCRGHYVPSLHAEQRAILSYYGLKVNYNSFKGWYFYDQNYKAKKLEVAVVRVFKNGELANARPCRRCLEMMKDLGIKKVHYSSGLDKEIITENVKEMISIHESSSSKRFERFNSNCPKNDLDYYKNSLKKNSPLSLKRINLIHFIRFNLIDLLPECSYTFLKVKGKTYFKMYKKFETRCTKNNSC